MTASQLRITAWAVLVFFFLVGVGLFAVGIRLWFWANQSTTWPRVNGHLVTVEFSGSTARIGRAHVVYDYMANGQSHQGDRSCFGGIGASERSRLAQMRSGDSIEVSVDPQDDSRSVLFPGVTAGARIPAIIGMVVVVFVALVTLVIQKDPPWKLS